MKLDKYIYWRTLTERVTLERYIEIERWFVKYGEPVETERKCVFEDWTKKEVNYKIVQRGQYKTIYTSIFSDTGYWVLKAYTANLSGKAPVTETGAITGWKAHSLFFSLVETMTGQTMKTAFGTVPASLYRKHTPRTPFYIDARIAGLRLRPATGADFSSHYPASARGPLPDAHKKQVKMGRVEPSPEFPFAFYSSGHVAEFGRFDTHKWTENVNNIWYKVLGLDRSGAPMYNEEEEEYTVLMKAAPVTLNAVWDYLYQAKEGGDPEAKAIMNMAIGTLHRNPEHQDAEDMNDYYHVAAVILCRANQTIMEKAEQIMEAGGVVLQIVVDGIDWINCPASKVAVPENRKELGAFVIEYDGATFQSTGKINNYTVTDAAGNLVKEAHSGNRRQ